MDLGGAAYLTTGCTPSRLSLVRPGGAAQYDLTAHQDLSDAARQTAASLLLQGPPPSPDWQAPTTDELTSKPENAFSPLEKLKPLRSARLPQTGALTGRKAVPLVASRRICGAPGQQGCYEPCGSPPQLYAWVTPRPGITFTR